MKKENPKKKRNRLQMFAACAPGVEDILHEELSELKVARIRPLDGGVEFTGDLATVVRANLRVRCAERILLRLAQFHQVHLDGLRQDVRALPLGGYIRKKARVHVSATCKKSKIFHSEAAAERVAIGIQECVGLVHTPTVKGAAPEGSQLVMVRIDHDECTISLDTTGERLHRRGYKQDTSEAPLRETIAAAALRFCGYDASKPLVDPLCGSGTFPIEAALIATRTAPGLARRMFAFDHWPCMEKEILAAERKRVRNYAIPLESVIQGSDADPNALDAAEANCARAGFESQIPFQSILLQDVALPETPGLVICNPPWGKRLADDDLRPLYGELGALITRHPGWKFCMVTSSGKLAKATGLKFAKLSPPIPLGGIRMKFYVTE